MTSNSTSTHDPRDVPNYTPTESARWLGIVPSTLRVWLQGQNYRTKGGTKFMQPVIRAADRDPLGLSFWNLVECSVLASIRKDHEVSLQKVRRALAYVSKELGRKRPLIEEDFSTDGVHLFVERYGKLISASEQGQVAMRELLEAGLMRIDRDEAGLAARLFPWRRDPSEPRVVSVDPRVSFGRPVLAGTGVTVEVILGRFFAGDTIEALARDYRVSQDRIEGLVRWGGDASAA